MCVCCSRSRNTDFWLADLKKSSEPSSKDGSASDPALHILVANTHLFWDPEFPDVKLIQTMWLLRTIQHAVRRYGTELYKPPDQNGESEKPFPKNPPPPPIPVFLCGDFNS